MYTYIGLHAAQGTAISGPTNPSNHGMGSDRNQKHNCLGSIPLKSPDDNFYRACVVLIPDAGVFYCHRERRKETAGVQNSHIPMDINWLRLRYNAVKNTVDNWFSGGSYIVRIADGDCPVWKWSVRRSELNLLPPNCSIAGLTPRLREKCIHKTYQITDEDGPALPPDFVDGEDLSTRFDCNRLTGLYRRAYCTSNSARRGCRHYAGGFLHKNIDPKTTFVIDPTKCVEVDLLVEVHIQHSKQKLALRRHSVVQIRYLPVVVGDGCGALLQDINNHCNAIRRNYNGSARAGKGDIGQMHPIGTRINTSGNKVRYRASSDASSVRLLSKAVVASSKLASVTIPGVLRVAQDLENDASMTALKGMDGDGNLCYVTHSMDLSVNLSNSSHYDVNDASQGFSIWTEEKPGTTDSWYFVLPNMIGTFPDSEREYYGIAIKLTHGVLISWDGRLIRHCTSVMSRRGGNVFGTFFAAKTKVIKYGMLDAQRKKEQKSSLGSVVVPDDGDSTVHGAVPGGGVAMIGNCKVASSIVDLPVDDDDDDCSASTIIGGSETEEEVDNDDDESHDDGISVGGT